MDANTESGRIHPLRVHIQSVSVHEITTQCLLLMFMFAESLALWRSPICEAEGGTWL